MSTASQLWSSFRAASSMRSEAWTAVVVVAFRPDSTLQVVHKYSCHHQVFGTWKPAQPNTEADFLDKAHWQHGSCWSCLMDRAVSGLRGGVSLGWCLSHGCLNVTLLCLLSRESESTIYRHSLEGGRKGRWIFLNSTVCSSAQLWFFDFDGLDWPEISSLTTWLSWYTSMWAWKSWVVVSTSILFLSPAKVPRSKWISLFFLSDDDVTEFAETVMWKH